MSLSRTLLTLALYGCDIDVLDYLAHEMDAHPDRMLIDHVPEGFTHFSADDRFKREIVCTYSEDHGYGVSFRELDISPGKLITDEFDTLALQIGDGEWPLARRSSRRKEVPGSWIE
jgi:hypothetical protein